MNPPPIPDDWRTDWHLAAHLDQLATNDAVEVTVAGISLQIRYEESALGGLTGEPVKCSSDSH